jgi:hypothetical protein
MAKHRRDVETKEPRKGDQHDLQKHCSKSGSQAGVPSVLRVALCVEMMPQGVVGNTVRAEGPLLVFIKFSFQFFHL